MRAFRTPREHLAQQLEALGRPLEARRVRNGRLNVNQSVAVRAIEAAQLEAMAGRVRRGEAATAAAEAERRR